jgi:hypothetical protein
VEAVRRERVKAGRPARVEHPVCIITDNFFVQPNHWYTLSASSQFLFPFSSLFLHGLLSFFSPFFARRCFVCPVLEAV